MLRHGIYEQVINKEISDELKIKPNIMALTGSIDETEAAAVLTQYIREVINKGLSIISQNQNGLENQIELVNKIIEVIYEASKDNLVQRQEVDRSAKLLLAVYNKESDLSVINGRKDMIRPTTSIAMSSLFTGIHNEPSMYEEIRREIPSANSIYMLVSFIKWSGLRLIINELKNFTQKGGHLSVITTSYMGATDFRAIEELEKLPNTRIRVSYDTKRTRLHAKAYVFNRETGFTTAYIGSSNLSNAAISSGLEWNIKVTEKDLPETIRKIRGTFDSYWYSSDFVDYKEDQKDTLRNALRSEKISTQDPTFSFDIIPYSYQQEILDKLSAERSIHGRYRNLIIAATGTGKTVISAFDYLRFCKDHPKDINKLLFIAHREEILRQSLSCFRGVLKDLNFGSLYVGDNKPDDFNHLFMSIQTFNSQAWHQKTSVGYYDYIIVDEFHHAAAPTYRKLLAHYKPKILLGLTATPERMDGKSIIEYFNNHIAAEIRLPEAIERKLLSPFHYFGVSDNVDLHELKWSRGGYDRTELSNAYTYNNNVANKRCEHILLALRRYVNEIGKVKGLGFCVSIAHAEFMAKWFNEHGIPSIHITGLAADVDRNKAKNRLIKGEINFIFVVDLYNEGVDIPEIDTILFLRPTESLTIFLQQLGRGLRLADDKDCLTVLDFIGQANKRYDFEQKLSALLSNTERSIVSEIKHGFDTVPKGCFVQLEPKAKENILRNIKSSISSMSGLINRISDFQESTGKPLSLANFVEHYHLDIKDIYRMSCFSRLKVRAGVTQDFSEPLEDILTKAFLRICSINSRRWIAYMQQVLSSNDALSSNYMNKDYHLMAQMFYFTIWQKATQNLDFNDYIKGIKSIRTSPTMCRELQELLELCYNRIDFIDETIDLGFDCPLDLHCNYTRDQILTGLDYLKTSSVREGVKWLPQKKTDILFVTLNKSEREYSPTTMYDDYSISESLFHWQSQSTTSENSRTGRRYINHKAQGTNILLFIRENKRNGYGGEPYTYLGPVDYLTHEGSKPMSITYKLRRPIPAKFIKKTNKLIVS